MQGGKFVQCVMKLCLLNKLPQNKAQKIFVFISKHFN